MRAVVTGDGFSASVMCARLAERGHNTDGMTPGATDAVLHLGQPWRATQAEEVAETRMRYEHARVAGAKVFVYALDSFNAAAQDAALEWLRAQLGGPAVIGVRLYHPIGAYKGLTEWCRAATILPVLVDRYRTGRPFIIHGSDYGTADGTPMRTYTNVVDAVDLVLMVLEIVVAGGTPPIDVRTQLLECGTPEELTVLQVVESVRRHLGPVHVRYGPRRGDDLARLPCRTPMVRWLPRPWIRADASIRDEVQTLAAAGGA